MGKEETKRILFTKNIRIYAENPKETIIFRKIIYQGHWIQGQNTKTNCFFIYQQQTNGK